MTVGDTGARSAQAPADAASINSLTALFYEETWVVTVATAAAAESTTLANSAPSSSPAPRASAGQDSDAASMNSLLGLFSDDVSDLATAPAPTAHPTQNTSAPTASHSCRVSLNSLLALFPEEEDSEHALDEGAAVAQRTPQPNGVQRAVAVAPPPAAAPDSDANSDAGSNNADASRHPAHRPETTPGGKRKTKSDRKREIRLGLTKRGKFSLKHTIIVEGYGLRTWGDAVRYREASWINPERHRNRHKDQPGKKDIRPGVRYAGEAGVVGAVPDENASPDVAAPTNANGSADARGDKSQIQVGTASPDGHRRSASTSIVARLRNAVQRGRNLGAGDVQDAANMLLKSDETCIDKEKALPKTDPTAANADPNANKPFTGADKTPAQTTNELPPWVIHPGPPLPLPARVRKTVVGGRSQPVEYSKSWETQEGWPLSAEEKKRMQIDDLSLTGARGEYLQLDRVLLIDRPPEIRDPEVLSTIQYTYGKQATKWPITINLLTLPPSYGGRLPKEAAYMISLLAKQQVSVKRANLTYTKESFDWSARRRLRWANLDMDAATAFFLICCIRHNTEWCQELLRLHHENIARTIRRYSLLALVGSPPVKRFLSSRRRAFSFDMDFTLVQAHHDILVAHIRNPIHQQRNVLSFTVDDLLYFLGYSEAAWARSLLYTRHTDVAYIGQQFGLVYAALMSAIADTLDDTTQRDADKDAALAALIALTTGSISVGGNFIPVSGAGNLVTDTAKNVGAVLFDRVTARHKFRQQALQQGIHRITTAFNLKILSAADRGVIPGLDLLSPPSDPDLIPIVVPTITPRVLRPTPNDISVFKASACNVILLNCHGLDISLDGQLLVVGEAPAVQLLQEDTYHHTVERYDPEPALRAELARHYPASEIEARLRLIAEFARQSQYPQIMVWKESYGDDLERKLLQVVNPWSKQLDQLLLHNKQNKPRVQPDPTTPQGRLRVLMDELRVVVARREAKAVTPVMIAEQVRYFFIDPPTLIQLKSEGCKVTPRFL